MGIVGLCEWRFTLLLCYYWRFGVDIIGLYKGVYTLSLQKPQCGYDRPIYTNSLCCYWSPKVYIIGLYARPAIPFIPTWQHIKLGSLRSFRYDFFYVTVNLFWWVIMPLFLSRLIYARKKKNGYNIFTFSLYYLFRSKKKSNFDWYYLNGLFTMQFFPPSIGQYLWFPKHAPWI